VLGAIALPAAAVGPQQADQVVHSATYAVFVRGARIGFENVTVTRTGGGWLISSAGTIGAPIDLTNAKFEIAYASDWHPQRLTIEAATGGQSLALGATFGLTTVTIDMSRGLQRGSTVQQISARSIVLPGYFFAGYEALTARMATAIIGSRYPVYLAPQNETSLTVTAIGPRRLATPSGPIDMRQVEVSIARTTGAQTAELWIDSNHHLARLVVPSEGLTVIREDLVSIAIREERITHPGDQQVFIPSVGFNLAGTYTRPTGATGRLPAVILVAGPGPQDRDETIAGSPIFGKLAGALANAGMAVVRYDKRGTGQSGGRTEFSTLDTYASDVIQAVTWLRRRKDIDADRIAVAGYGEGGPVALLAAAREKRIAGAAFIASPGRTGRDVVLEQQRLELEGLNISEAERTKRIALQRQIIDAMTIGTSWDQVPPALRQASDTPWFKSWLLFDPSVPMKKAGQPMLILHGELDREVPPAHADALDALARARKKPATHAQKHVATGVNHLLVTARTGAPDEYESLAAADLAPGVTSVLIGWLRDTVFAQR
jgi:hypothetical protein